MTKQQQILLAQNKFLRKALQERCALLKDMGKVAYVCRMNPLVGALNAEMIASGHSAFQCAVHMVMTRTAVDELLIVAAAQLTEDILCRPGVN